MNPRTRRLLWVVLGSIIALQVILGIALGARIPRSSAILHKRIVETLSARLDSEVAIEGLTLRWFPTLRAEGSGLTIRKRGQDTSLPPLIAIKSFTVDATLMGLARRHVSKVTVGGLEIQVPPNRGHDEPEKEAPAAMPGPARDPSFEETVTIDVVESEGARLVIIPGKPNKRPKVWDIHRLRLENVGRNDAMPFKATLTNAIPPGEIETAGLFGPWHREGPGGTPLHGTFTFARADLSVFRGIGGTLSATGSFRGVLDRLVIDGETDTPDFTVKVSGHPLPLRTKYRSVVDGTNGDTILERIDATFLQSSLIAMGSVVDGPADVRGRIVTLDIDMHRARIEDVLRMVVKDPKPPMRGALKLTTKFLLPPGERDVVDRLQLDGRFAMDHVQFTRIDVQQKIDELSHRSRGRKADAEHDRVASNFTGRFRLGDGQLALPDLSFAVPGSRVEVSGKYALRAETLDFLGTVLMDAKISQMTSGFKSLLLKVVDPLFRRKGAGAAIPIKVHGSWNNPQFGLDMRRVFRRSKT